MENKSAIKNNVTLLTKILYGFGGMFCYTLAGRFSLYYRLYFLTDVAKLPTAMAALIYSSSTIIGIITMLLSGIIVDSTNLKLGKYRSWILIGNLITYLFCGLSFITINSMNPWVYGVMLLVFSFAQTLAYNLSWISSRSLVGPMSVTTTDQVGLASASTLGMQAAGFVAGPLVLAVLSFWTKGSMAQSYMMIQYTLGLTYVIGAVVLMKISKKYDLPKPQTNNEATKAQGEKVTLMAILKNLKGPMIPYFISCVVTNTYSGFFSALLAYYTTYYLNNPGATAISQTAYSCGSIIGALLAPKICSILGLKKSYIISLFTTVVSFIPLLFIPPVTMYFYVVRALNGFCQAPSGTAMVAMANDIADNAAMHGNLGARGFTQSMLGSAIRIGFIISASISSFSLAAIGYVAGSVPSAQVLDAIIKLIVIGPSISAGLGGALMFFYKVDEKALTEFRANRNSIQE